MQISSAAGPSPEFTLRHLRSRTLAVAAIAALAAAGAMWLSAQVHTERACRLHDTAYPLNCEPSQAPAAAGQLAPARSRIASTPGDSRGWVEFALRQDSAVSAELADALSVLAPSDPDSLRLRARTALQAGNQEAAVDPLAKMTEYDIGGSDPPQILARMLAAPSGVTLLERELTVFPGQKWLPTVLRSTGALKLPTDHALALLTTGAAHAHVDEATVDSFIGILKDQGRWSDAYALWLAQKKGPVPALFNGDFDAKFDPSGFDWETIAIQPGQPVIDYGVRNSENGHHALEINFSGRSFPTPILRQRMFLPPGRYVIEGEFAGTTLRSDEGLAWGVRCANEQAPIALSERMKTTHGRWNRFTVEFSVLPSCGPYTSFELQPAAAYEAGAGMKGRIAFRAIRIRQARA